MASSLPNVKKLLQTASAGEKEALKHLGIDRGFTYEYPPRFNPATTSKEALQQQLTDTIFFTEAANRLHLDSAEEIARTAIQHIIHSYFCLFSLPDVDSILSGPDLAKELLDNVVELTWATQILHRFEKEGSKKQKTVTKQQKTAMLPTAKVAVTSTIRKALPPKAVPLRTIILKGSARLHHQSRLPQRRQRHPPFRSRHQAKVDPTTRSTPALCQSAHSTAVTFVDISKPTYENARWTKMKSRRCWQSSVLARSSVETCKRGKAADLRRASERSGARYLPATKSF